MSVERNLDRELASWLDEQTTTPPGDLLATALGRIERVRQRPGFLTRDRYTSRSATLSLSPLLTPAVLLLVLLLAAAAIGVGSRLALPRPAVVAPNPEATTAAVWQPTSQIAFRAQLADAVATPFKWRAGTYSEYTNRGWASGDLARHEVDAGQPLDIFSREGDAPVADGRVPLAITVTPGAFGAGLIVGPSMLTAVDRTTEAMTIGRDRWYAGIQSKSTADPYTVSALVGEDSGVPGGLTEARLRAAGSAYSPEMLALFTALPEDAIGPAATALLEDIRSRVRGREGSPDNAYDLARTMETYLASDRFEYRDDVRDMVAQECGSGVSTVECFARIRAGYCEYYASTMAVLLRSAGVPTRIAYGFLPGERDGSGLEVVAGANAHQWVEVYFPGAGWVEFDPTGGGIGQPQAIPSGGVTTP